MIILELFCLYIILGCIWTLWLEHYTVNELEPPYNQPWNNRERFFHTLLWVGSFGVFVYTLIKDFFGNFFD
jgi:hypothetical protein